VPGEWVITSGRGTEVAASCEVTPQAQNTGISPARIVDRISKFRCCQVADADVTIIADVHRRPWVQVKSAVVICTARTALLRGHSRMVTTSFRGERPGGRQSRW